MAQAGHAASHQLLLPPPCAGPSSASRQFSRAIFAQLSPAAPQVQADPAACHQLLPALPAMVLFQHPPKRSRPIFTQPSPAHLTPLSAESRQLSAHLFAVLSSAEVFALPSVLSIVALHGSPALSLTQILAWGFLSLPPSSAPSERLPLVPLCLALCLPLFLPSGSVSCHLVGSGFSQMTCPLSGGCFLVRIAHLWCWLFSFWWEHASLDQPHDQLGLRSLAFQRSRLPRQACVHPAWWPVWPLLQAGLMSATDEFGETMKGEHGCLRCSFFAGSCCHLFGVLVLHHRARIFRVGLGFPLADFRRRPRVPDWVGKSSGGSFGAFSKARSS